MLSDVFRSGAGGWSLLLLSVCLTTLGLPDNVRADTEMSPSRPRWVASTGHGLVFLSAPVSEMILVRAARFNMGSTPLDVTKASLLCRHQRPAGLLDPCPLALFADEQPRHSVTLSGFWLDRMEVTVADYERCVKLRRCAPVGYDEGATRFDRPNLPVSLVSFSDAQNYCRYAGKRLPTEAEFELAARGLRGRVFPWGDLYHPSVANHGRAGVDRTDDRDGFSELSPVGSFPSGRTPSGFLDLAGNVAEWVFDRYGPYERQPVSNPRGPSQSVSGNVRSVRGGHYQSPPSFLRSAARMHFEASIARPYIGFRCAKPGPEGSLPTH